jgi:hypothetical protein
LEPQSQCFKCGATKAGANPTSVRLTRRARVHKQVRQSTRLESYMGYTPSQVL